MKKFLGQNGVSCRFGRLLITSPMTNGGYGKAVVNRRALPSTVDSVWRDGLIQRVDGFGWTKRCRVVRKDFTLAFVDRLRVWSPLKINENGVAENKIVPFDTTIRWHNGLQFQIGKRSDASRDPRRSSLVVLHLLLLATEPDLDHPLVSTSFFVAGRLFGRFFRNARARRTENRDDGKDATAARRRRFYGWGAWTAAAVLPAAYLWWHVETHPANGRRGLYLFDDDYIRKRSDLAERVLLDIYGSHVLDRKHEVCRNVKRLVRKLVDANSYDPAIRDQKWKVVVVERHEVNAFMLPNGTIFLFTGLVKRLDEDELLVVLGHEMTHLLHRHANQGLSLAVVGAALNLCAYAAFAVAVPHALAAYCVSVSFGLLCELALLRFHRDRELEADRDGLFVAARACADLSAGARFCGKFGGDREPPSDWLSTHPSPKLRGKKLEALVPEAERLQQSIGC